MPASRKVVALSIGLLGMLAVVPIVRAQKSDSADTQLGNIEATVEWYQKSDVSALREGVIHKMELRTGAEVQEGGEIGRLHKEVADLAVDEARIQAEGQGALLKADAQRKNAKAVVQRNNDLLKKGASYVSREEVQKGEAEFAMADAAVIEAQDTLKLAAAKLRSAERAALEHIITAPFSGQILKEFKHVGESVRANEPVVQLGNLDKVRVWAYIPVQYAYRVKPGCEIVIQPRLGKESTGIHPIEQKQFRGVISAVDQSIQPIGEKAVRIYADLDNLDHDLRPGLKAVMTISLKPEGVNSYASPTARGTVSGTAPSVGLRPNDLPPLPPR